MPPRRPRRPQPYATDNDPDVVPGRRVSKFFEVADPVHAGELSVAQLRTILSGLPVVLATTPLPVEGTPLERGGLIYVGGLPHAELEPEIQRARSPEHTSALAQWLGGMPVYDAAGTNCLNRNQFSDWTTFAAKALVGHPIIYSQLVEVSGIVPAQPGSITPA